MGWLNGHSIVVALAIPTHLVHIASVVVQGTLSKKEGRRVRKILAVFVLSIVMTGSMVAVPVAALDPPTVSIGELPMEDVVVQLSAVVVDHNLPLIMVDWSAGDMFVAERTTAASYTDGTTADQHLQNGTSPLLFESMNSGTISGVFPDLLTPKTMATSRQCVLGVTGLRPHRGKPQ